MEINYKGKKIFAFSDTHGKHRNLTIPADSDILICAGDAVEDDLHESDYYDFLEWYGQQPQKWKVFVPGNHELSFDIGEGDHLFPLFQQQGITLLNDAMEEIEGISFCSVTGNFHINDEDIPDDIDILVSHNAPAGILDDGIGSTDILNFVLKAKPRIHIFGHIHKTAGEEILSKATRFINVANIQ